MDGLRILAIALLIGGTLALVYGGFTYTEDRNSADLGPIEIAVEDKERVDRSLYAGTTHIGKTAVEIGLWCYSEKRPALIDKLVRDGCLRSEPVDFFTKDRCFDTTKAQRELGFSPQNDFETEVKNIYEWYQSKGYLQ